VLKATSKNSDPDPVLRELLLHSLTLCLQQSLQAKQMSLLERVDALDQECEKLQGQLGETEDTQTGLQDRLTHISEKDQLKTQLTQ
jgi:septal ring factor EnvC (AmiA/AmiB activator)